MIPEVKFISINSGCLMQSRFHPDWSILSKWRPPDARINPFPASLIGHPLGVECFGADFRIGPLSFRELPATLAASLVTPSDLPPVALQVLSSRV